MAASGFVAPTTRAQVTGHRFLVRRVHHGLVFGDIRMIHDPLARRRRALIFGLVATVLLSLGAGLFALVSPRAQPRDATILRASSGQLYVRVDDTVHAVNNLASARLIAGAPDKPAAVSDAALAGFHHGPTVGIVDAPGFSAPSLSDAHWALCSGPGADAQARTVVRFGQAPVALSESQGILARAHGTDMLITASGRAIMPAAHTPQGRALRRRLGITDATPLWTPPAAVLSAIVERPALSWPSPLPQVIDTEEESWIAHDNAVRPITRLQRDLLADLGAPVRVRTPEEMSALPDLGGDYVVQLPAQELDFIDPAQSPPCAIDDGSTVGVLDGTDGLSSGVELPESADGAFHADAFHSPADAAGARAVDTGAGIHVIGADGVRHGLPHPEDRQVLGLSDPQPAPWPVISVLPQGTPLDREHALRVQVVGS
ncbi:type VII secretion protein EccB [Corynebacterium uberis]|uniref:type VII secretion protein EccB n=1 Tax=Corynebacterium TaxID=1716 RepID=UPI001D0B096D|nr:MULTISPECIES: type VII secretion protein EccB [Corynebacterium]MCZ9309367.1 type VII secretion protein EccB [Corynebacterium sp. c6VSa_13]UDL72916.1 type VII secretion protein EccB [Corynebacterium uberis]UDL76207.1 type VII secretion protein EccB [Corynebacterium uberis]UDL78419.1 type VII secretion protein EccB [Corynebacterium uberis]UDL82837.1 type VII secretion protein EccB [Corynebacterium uberis]